MTALRPGFGRVVVVRLVVVVGVVELVDHSHRVGLIVYLIAGCHV